MPRNSQRDSETDRPLFSLSHDRWPTDDSETMWSKCAASSLGENPMRSPPQNKHHNLLLVNASYTVNCSVHTPASTVLPELVQLVVHTETCSRCDLQLLNDIRRQITVFSSDTSWSKCCQCMCVVRVGQFGKTQFNLIQFDSFTGAL